jgi:hypothetical protein
MRKTVAVAVICFWIPAVAQAQNCAAGKPKIPVRVTWVCPVEATSKGARCLGALSSTAVQEALGRANGLLPVCLQLSGPIAEDRERMSDRRDSWKPEDDFDALSHRQKPSWSILDVFVIGAFAPIPNRPTERIRGRASLGYVLRTVKRKKTINKKPIGPMRLEQDGMIIRKDVLLEAKSTTLAHETAHWLGLLHTFSEDDQCEDFGDDIDDTPAQSIKDRFFQTMGDADGVNIMYPFKDDPDCALFAVLTMLKAYDKTYCGDKITLKDLHNLMGYTNCRNDLTPLQQKAMLDVWDRRSKLSAEAKVYPNP